MLHSSNRYWDLSNKHSGDRRSDMVADNGGEIRPHAIRLGKRSLVEDLFYRESPSTASSTKHVVIVMDAMKEFSVEPLQWALLHVIKPGYIVTLLGLMPWLNVPLACKTWLDVWTISLGGSFNLREWSEWKKDSKYLKIQGIVELCDKYGVVPYMKVAMGYPLRLVVLEETTSLHATLVVFDRYFCKDKEFYAKRMPSNVMMINNDREVELLKVRPMIKSIEGNTPEESPGSIPIIAKVIISDVWEELSKNK